MPRWRRRAGAAGAVVLSGLLAGLGTAGAAGATAAAALTPNATSIPRTSDVVTAKRDAATACTLPDLSNINYYHCYTPQQIRAAYGVNGVAKLKGDRPNYGQGQTIVLVDSYGSPTAAHDLQVFHDTFFDSLPDPNFQQVFPQGNPQFGNSNGNGQSGPSAAAGWSGEATLDIEWAYAIAPLAHIILIGVPPAETEGVTGMPNLFKAISSQIDANPAGTLFSMSFGVTEQTFGGAAKTQTAKFDAVFKKGLAKGDNFFASSGDNGTFNNSKTKKDTGTYNFPTVGWPASSPYVTSVGGTQLQDGWTWNPTSNDAYLPSGAKNPAYWQSTTGGSSEAVWNESWAQIGTGGGVSTIYPKPSWQTAGPSGGRVVPDTSWNAAVNGGVEVYITAYPDYNCGNTTGCWTIYGGTSASSPQTAGLAALVNAARADAGKAPIGFLAPLLYSGIGADAANYKDIVPQHYGSAPKTFAGTDVGGSNVLKSVGDLVDNQMWEVPVAGYPTTAGFDATTGWGTPKAPGFVAALTLLP